MTLFGIADLHLSFASDKPMDIFGEHWKDHPKRIRAAWSEAITDRDIVLVPGDISWGTKEAQARPDLEWIHALAGTKVIVKGNHDYWWPKSAAKLRAILPDSIHPIRKGAVQFGSYVFFGTRGCDLVPLFGATEESVRTRLEKELRDLEASIAELDKICRGKPDLIKVALFHYPPFMLGESESPFTRRLEEIGARLCVYGHLHDPTEFAQTFQGRRETTKYRLLSADFLKFRPARLAD